MIPSSRRYRRIGTAMLGMVTAFLPLAGAYLLLMTNTHQQAETTVDELAGQLIRRAELAFDDGIAALGELAIAGITDCTEADYRSMRRAVYANYSLKEVGITDADGNLRCNHIGEQVTVVPMSGRLSARNKNFHLQVVRLGDTRQLGVMLHWNVSAGLGLAAVIPSEVVALDIMPEQYRETGLAVVSLSDGSQVGSIPTPEMSGLQPTFVGEAVSGLRRSARYPIQAQLTIPFETFWMANQRLRFYTVAGGGVVAVLILLLTVAALRRPDSQADELEEAIALGEFIPYYQPIVDIRDNRLVGCEVLIRRRLADGTIIPPGAFIALAESSGLAMPMTRSLMTQVRDDLSEVCGDHPHLRVAMNLFDDHFNNFRIVEDLEEIFGSSRIAYRQLVMELTERQPLRDIDRARTVIRRLQALGVRVALDDAGAGHGGLAYLQQLGVDVLKIDRLFVATIESGQEVRPILDSLLKLGRDLDMEVVAEGVETFEQVTYLRMHGVRAAQGYLFAPPLPKRAFLALVEAMSVIPTQQPPERVVAVA